MPRKPRVQFKTNMYQPSKDFGKPFAIELVWDDGRARTFLICKEELGMALCYDLKAEDVKMLESMREEL